MEDELVNSQLDDTSSGNGSNGGNDEEPRLHKDNKCDFPSPRVFRWTDITWNILRDVTDEALDFDLWTHLSR